MQLGITHLRLGSLRLLSPYNRTARRTAVQEHVLDQQDLFEIQVCRHDSPDLFPVDLHCSVKYNFILCPSACDLSFCTYFASTPHCSPKPRSLITTSCNHKEITKGSLISGICYYSLLAI